MGYQRQCEQTGHLRIGKDFLFFQRIVINQQNWHRVIFWKSWDAENNEQEEKAFELQSDCRIRRPEGENRSLPQVIEYSPSSDRIQPQSEDDWMDSSHPNSFSQRWV